jgi:hypothetical protein
MKPVSRIFSIFYTFLLTAAFCSDHEIRSDHLTFLYRKVKITYSKQLGDKSFGSQFTKSLRELKEYIVQSYQNSPIELFKIVEDYRHAQMTHFVIGTVIPSYMRGVKIGLLWKEHLDSQFESRDFFLLSKILMRLVARMADWARAKEVSSILLSIQKQYLRHLAPYKREMKRTKRRIKLYEFILNSFNPNGKDDFLNLYYFIQLMAFKNEGKLPKTLYISKLTKLFIFYCHRYYKYNRDVLGDISNIPPELCYLMIHQKFVSQRSIFSFLNSPNSFLSDSTIFDIFILDDFQNIGKTYRARFNPSFDIWNNSCYLIEFMHICINSKEYVSGLGENDIWLIEAALHTFSLFED